LASKRPSILILMPDQLRADSMGCAGHPQIKTPNMDLLASEGVRFSSAFTVCPICMPARASFINGLYPHNHGMWTNVGQMPAKDETFFHHLQDSGYYIAHVGKSHYYMHSGQHMRDCEDYMHARGIDYVHETTGPWATVTTDSYMTDHWREKGLLQAFRDDYLKRRQHGHRSVWPSPLPVDEFLDSYVGRKAVEFIDSYNEDKPFCLFVGFGGPHEPWDAPGEYATMYDPDDTPPHIPPAEPGEWVTEHGVQRMRQGRIDGMTEEEIQKIRANYYGKISLIDRWFGEIFVALQNRGWWDDMLVVFWSDHGEMAGDHLRLHKSVFYDSSVRVPLIIRWPGQISSGATSSSLAQNIDVYPTLLEAVGAGPSKRCFGKSLWPTLRDPNVGHREALFSEISSRGYHNTMVRTDRYKYAMDNTGEGYMLYDVAEDPKEQSNLIGHPDFRDIERECRDRILRFLVDTQCRMSRER
jgi:arylsulfatase A-like enzyme